ncbi:hypothetical protein Rhopal_000427-T1 [Rhodotorula paludigena]|uniref:Ankyrin n=1 Tax=Rhodotorula paludigena TaxID=86838 RepID=A0AAV5GBM0_9BASI|nr:hypothetical protein Rhopal_000427-T1 [Rhodotorula paludigena]
MATPNHRLIYAAKTDSEEMLLEVLTGPEPFDVNYQDGLGQTGESLSAVEWGPTASTAARWAASQLLGVQDALHYAASSPSPDALQLLLDRDDTDVDLQNRLDRATPLHLAVKLEHEAARQGVIEMLLDAGADPSLKDIHGLKVQDYLHPDRSEVDKAIQHAIRVALSERTMGGVSNNADLANDDDDGEPGSGSDSD